MLCINACCLLFSFMGMQELQTSLNDRVFGDLLNYISNAHSSHNMGNYKMELPAAAVVTGNYMLEYSLY